MMGNHVFTAISNFTKRDLSIKSDICRRRVVLSATLSLNSGRERPREPEVIVKMRFEEMEPELPTGIPLQTVRCSRKCSTRAT